MLDDYQFISSQAVHEQVLFLLEHCPASLHLLIASRSDPPLPLARLRVRGQMIELRTADLRFTPDEAAQFLNEIMSLHLDAGIGRLAPTSYGGMDCRLANGSAVYARPRRCERVYPRLLRSNRYILDYLLEEILSRQSPQIQHFLLYTSVLERLTAPLCDALLVNDEEAPRGPDGGSSGSELLRLGGSTCILEYLERANLFWCPWMMRESGTAITICLLTCCVPNSSDRLARKALHNYTFVPLTGMGKMDR